MENAVLLFLSLAFICTLHAQDVAVHQNTPAMSQHFGHGTPKLSPLLDMDHKSYTVQLRGRWTLIYFWADWCMPCIGKGIPDLIAFQKSHEAEKNRFQIIAIRFGSTHENYVWKNFYAKTQHLEQAVWHQVPPFPIVYDDSSQFSTDWGIHALPTEALVDPKGNLVRDGNIALLGKVLEAQN